MNSSGGTNTTGLLLVGHGTRLAEGTDEFRVLAERLSERLAPMAVEGCLLEFQRPTIPEAWQRLIDRGVREIRVAPLLLFAAGHARQDIPEIIGQCRSSCPDVASTQSGPLSRAPSIIDLLQRRIETAAAADGNPIEAKDVLVMVGRGSHDPCAQADMKVLSEVVAKRCGIRNRHVAFYAMADPRLGPTLNRLASELSKQHSRQHKGRQPRLIIQPHLLFRGRLFDSIAEQVETVRQQYPEIRFVTGDYLGPCEEVVEAIVRRAFPTVVQHDVVPS